MNNGKDVYFVAVKIFLENTESCFLITKDVFGDWDIPGGRLRANDFDESLEKVVQRKMSEELGSAVQYELREPIVFMRHERDEILSTGEREKRRIFAIGYRALYKGGEIHLGENHEKFEWVDVDTFVPENYFTGGWLNGVREYIQKRKST